MHIGQRIWAAVAAAAVLVAGSATAASATSEGSSPAETLRASITEETLGRDSVKQWAQEASALTQIDLGAAAETVAPGQDLVWNLTTSLDGPDTSAFFVLPGYAEDSAYAKIADDPQVAAESDFQGSLELQSVEVTNAAGEKVSAFNVECAPATDPGNGVLAPALEWGEDCGPDTAVVKVTAADGVEAPEATLTVTARASGGEEGDRYVAWATGFGVHEGTRYLERVAGSAIVIGEDGSTSTNAEQTPAEGVQAESETPAAVGANDTDAAALVQNVPGASARSCFPSDPAWVEGIMKLEDGTPIPGIKVQIYERHADGSKGMSFWAPTVTNAQGFFSLTLEHRNMSFLIVIDKASVDKVLGTNWKLKTFSLEEPIGPLNQCWGTQYHYVFEGKLGGGGNEGGTGESAGGGKAFPAKINVKKGVSGAQGIENTKSYATPAAIPDSIPVTSEIRLYKDNPTDRDQTASSLTFKDQTSGNGGSVNWERCTRYLANGTAFGVHTFATQPTTPQMLVFKGTPGGDSTAVAHSQYVQCTGNLDPSKIREGNPHTDTVTVVSQGSASLPGETDWAYWTSSQTFTAKLAETGVVSGTVKDDDGTPIKDVQVLLIKVDGVTETPELSIATEDDGTYSFGDVEPGSYRIQFTAPSRDDDKVWEWVSPSEGKSDVLTVARASETVQDGVAKLADAPAPEPVETGTWLTKSPAKVICDPEDADTCDVTWDIVAYNGSSQSVNLATFTDVTSKEVYDVQATVRAPVAQLAVGAGYTLALGADGTIWAFGSNTNGKLGDGTNTNRAAPVKVKFERTGNGLNPGEVVVQVVAANNTSYAMTSEGRVFAWGLDSKGQLGTGAGTDSEPRLVQNVPDDFVYITAGNQFAVGLTASGDLWSWGDPDDGRLGNGESSGAATAPAKILDGSTDPVLQVSAGLDHTLAVTASGALYVWGNDTNGKLGLGTCNGDDQLTPVKLDLPERFVQVAAGNAHSMALTEDGDVYTWGTSQYGVLGYDTPSDAPTCNSYKSVTTPTKVDSLSGVFSITAGRENSFALTGNDTVWSWGRNNAGQLGNDTPGATHPSSTVPVQVTVPDGVDVLEIRAHSSAEHFLILGSDGGLYGWGSNSSNQLTQWLTNPTRLPRQIQTKGTPKEYLDLGNTDELELMVASDDPSDIVVSQLPDGCDEDDGTPECAPREVTFVERKYVSTEHEENEALNLRPHSRAFITVSGKVDRGAKGYTIGNQAYYDSDKASFGDAPELKPLFPEFDQNDPWAYGVWSGGTVCVPGQNTACDQVWASVDKSANLGLVSGTVTAEDPDDSGSFPAAAGVTVQLYKGTPGSDDAELIDSTETEADGAYSFDVAFDEGYFVKFVLGSLPEPPEGFEWTWKSPIDGISQGFDVATKDDHKVINAKAVLQRVIATSMSVSKGWKDANGDIHESVTYGGDTQGQSETVTVEVHNDGDDALEDFEFTDATGAGDDVSWSSCSVLDDSGEAVPGQEFEFASGDSKQPDEVVLGTIVVEAGQTLSCVGSLELDGVTKDHEHQDTVTIGATGQTGGKGLVGDGTFTAVFSDSGELGVEKGVLVTDEGTGDESIESNHYIPYNESESVTVRVSNGGDQKLSGIEIADTTVEGPDVEGLDASCAAIDELASDETQDCSGTLAMTAYKHRDTVAVTAVDEDGGVYKTYADFEAQSGGSLPRAGQLGIWAAVLAGVGVMIAAGILRGRVTRPATVRKH